jgi:hypothetical protein
MYYSAALWCSPPFPSNPSMGAEMLMARWRLVVALIVGQGTGHKVHLSCGWSGALALRSTRATLGHATDSGPASVACRLVVVASQCGAG